MLEKQLVEELIGLYDKGPQLYHVQIWSLSTLDLSMGSLLETVTDLVARSVVMCMEVTTIQYI